MPQYFGNVQRLELSSTLWLVLLPPLLGAVTAALVTIRRGDTLKARLPLLSLLAALGSLALALWHVTTLLSLPGGGRHLYRHGWQMARIGSLSFDFGLALDPLSAAALLVTTAAGVTLHLALTRRAEVKGAEAHRFTSLHLGLFSALLFILGDGFVPMLFGLHGLGLSSLMVAGKSKTKSFIVHRLGEAGLMAGSLVLLWGLGGRWLPDGIYQPDLEPRFVAVTSGGEERGAELSPIEHAGDEASMLTFATLPGAELHLNHAPLGSSPLVRAPIEAARHSVRLVPGGTDDEYEVNWFLAKPGAEVAIAPIGPTLVFREIRDQLNLQDDEGRMHFYESLRHKRLFGISLIALVCALFCAPALAQAAQFRGFLSRRDAQGFSLSGYFQAALALIASVYLLARLWFLFSLTNIAAEIIIALVVASAVLILGARPRGASESVA